jgi:arylsulfatase A-like enzyme
MFSLNDDAGGILNWRVGRTDPYLTPEQLQNEIDAYDGAIRYTDEQIGLLLENLASAGLLSNTMVIITSDHGEAFGEHGLYLHAHSLYREVIEVPLILYYPPKVPTGLMIDQPVSNFSIAETILALISNEPSGNASGNSLVSLWEDPTANSSWPAPISELSQQPWTEENYPVQKGWIKSLVNDPWHYIVYENGQNELFNWDKDPIEQKNMVEEPDLQSVRSNLHNIISSLPSLR